MISFGIDATFKLVTHDQVNSLIEEHFGFREYNMVEIEELMNGVYKLFCVDFASAYDIEKVDTRSTLYSTCCYLNVLCTKGIIEPGPYLVQISW